MKKSFCMKKDVTRAAFTSLALSMISGVTVFAATSHFANSANLANAAKWANWKQTWKTVSTDYTKVAMNPGANETQLNFTWMTEDNGNPTPVVKIRKGHDAYKEFTGTTTPVDTKYTNGVQYVSNKVTVTGLEPGNTYYYKVVKNGVESVEKRYNLSSTDNVKFFVLGDPQIGASKGQSQEDAKLVNTDGVSNTAARNDAWAFDRTLKTAYKENPDADFIVSCGDQVNKTGKIKEEEFAGYLNSEVLTSLPVASTIGNHDSLTDDYSNHFTPANVTGLGKTAAGSDYYYSYGDILFIVLNTNNYNIAEHRQAMEQAVQSNPHAKWRVVTIHQDIYGSGKDHSETDGMILRTQLTPLFDSFNVDVVLQGHDHQYSRSKLLYGDGKTHNNYEFLLNSKGDDYDWDHAHDITTNKLIAWKPVSAQETADLAAFRADNHCYTLEETSGNKVTDPKGILYVTTNSASGSKFYELNPTQQDYIAERSQNWLPCYSVVDVKGNDFTINTYQIAADGSVQAIDQPFTIEKTTTNCFFSVHVSLTG